MKYTAKKITKLRDEVHPQYKIILGIPLLFVMKIAWCPLANLKMFSNSTRPMIAHDKRLFIRMFPNYLVGVTQACFSWLELYNLINWLSLSVADQFTLQKKKTLSTTENPSIYTTTKSNAKTSTQPSGIIEDKQCTTLLLQILGKYVHQKWMMRQLKEHLEYTHTPTDPLSFIELYINCTYFSMS